MTMYTLETLNGAIHIDLNEDYEVLGEFKKYPHWGWWLFSLLVFWPILFLLSFVGYVNNIKIVRFGNDRQAHLIRENDFTEYLLERGYVEG